jgi:hypothetical protein
MVEFIVRAPVFPLKMEEKGLRLFILDTYLVAQTLSVALVGG